MKLVQKIFYSIFLFLSLFFLSYSVVHAATYYVDKNSIGGTCSDTLNTGTSVTSPYCTFTKAHAVVTAGDTVYFRAATYSAMLITKSGAPGAYITFASYPSERAIVDAAATAYGIRTTNTTYVEINGFEVKNAGGNTSAGILLKGQPITGTDYTLTLSYNNRIINNIVHDNINGTNTTNGIGTIDSSYNVIQGNTVYNNYDSGIGLIGNTDVTTGNNQIIGNTVYNNTASGGNSDGVNFSGNKVTNNLVRGNIIYGNSDDGIDTWATQNNTIEFNIVHDQCCTGNGNGIKAGGSSTGGGNIVRYNISYHNQNNGLDSNGSGGNQFYNNVSFNNGHHGIEDATRANPTAGCNPVETSACYGTLKNNISMNNTVDDISAGPMTKTSDYNIFYSSTLKLSFSHTVYSTLSAYQAAGGMGLDAHSLTVDPQFTDTASNNFHLLSTSPAIDAGTDIGLSQDFDGAVVPYGSAPDIGAYEWFPYVAPVVNSPPAVGSGYCNDVIPVGTPNLFRIDPSQNGAKLFFTTLRSNITGYAITYGYSPTDERFATTYNYNGPFWIIDPTINHLNPNTAYYFRVRAINGCVGGATSGVMKTTTLGRLASNIPSTVLTTVVPTPMSTPLNLNITPQITISPSPVPIPTIQPVPNAQPESIKHKFCFLWWCF